MRKAWRLHLGLRSKVIFPDFQACPGALREIARIQAVGPAGFRAGRPDFSPGSGLQARFRTGLRLRQHSSRSRIGRTVTERNESTEEGTVRINMPPSLA